MKIVKREVDVYVCQECNSEEFASTHPNIFECYICGCSVCMNCGINKWAFQMSSQTMCKNCDTIIRENEGYKALVRESKAAYAKYKKVQEMIRVELKKIVRKMIEERRQDNDNE